MRVGALERAGLAASAVVVERRARRLHPAALLSPGDPEAARSAGRREVLEALERLQPALVIVASATPGGGTVGRWVPRRCRALWWPTGIRPGPVARLGAGPLAPITLARGAGAGLEGSVIEAAGRARLRHGPWDGDFVLVPLAPAPLEAGQIVRAFAAVARRRDALDLVVLSTPEPRMSRLARDLGIGTRVHFAGPAPRPAEHAWARSAAAAMLGVRGALSGGAVLRLLSAGCPILVTGGAEPGRSVQGWLERHGCLAAPHRSGVPGDALEKLLERGPAVGRAIERGRSLAEQHASDAFAARLAAALRPTVERRRQAA